MYDARRWLLALILVVAARQAAVPQANAPQSAPPSPPLLASQSAKLAEADRLSVATVKLHGQEKFDEALPLAERALKLREEAAGSEHPSVAQALKNLSAIYLAKGKADKGRQLYTRALSIYEKNPAANTANIFKLLDALGVIERFAFNNFPVAAKHYERSLALKQASLGAEHEDVILTLYNLAELYELIGHNDKALATHRRVIGIREKHEAARPDDLRLALNRFACLSERLDMKVETAEARRRVEEFTAREDERRAREDAALAGVQSTWVSSGRVLNGRAISKPQPSYPEVAKQYRISGVVSIFVTVDETGRVVAAYPCGHPLLAEASLRAAYRARFSPTLLDGKPVKVNGVITYKFVLQ